MSKEQQLKDITRSLHNAPRLTHEIPPFEVKDEDVNLITYIGFNFHANQPISTKLYYRPDTDYARIITQTAGQAGNFFETTNETILKTGARLYDFSFEKTPQQDELSLRAIWHLPLQVRQNELVLERWLDEFLCKFNFSKVCRINLDIESKIRFYNGSSLSPIFHVGGYFDPSGDLKTLKVNYDMDVVDRGEALTKRKPVYKDVKVLQSLTVLLPQYLPKQDAGKWLYLAGEIVDSGYHLETYGLHFSRNRLEEFKIYFRTTDGEKVHGQCLIKKAFEEAGIDGYNDFITLTSYYLKMGWNYTGFNIAFSIEGNVMIKFYMQK